MRFRASYFDGLTSKRHAAEVRASPQALTISADVERTYYQNEWQVPERVRRDVRRLNFVDGAYIEVHDEAEYRALLSVLGYREPQSVSLYRNWRGTLLAISVLLAVLLPGYLYGLPGASRVVANHLPEKAQHAIGREALDFLDKRLFQPTALPVERQQAILARFYALTLPKRGLPSYEILFRKSRAGPNAFALPSGQIVLTDEMIALLGNDDAIMGVLAHELGHLHERHLLRRIIQGSAVGLVTMLLFGDVSSTVAAIPATLLDLKYSRDAEREADEYAIAMMKVNGIPLTGLQQTFEKLGSQSIELSTYLSSHPPTAERIERIKLAERSK